MEHHPSWLGDFFNWLFGGFSLKLAELFGIHIHDPAHLPKGHEGEYFIDATHPIPDFMASEITIFLGCIVFFLWFRNRLSIDSPGGIQLVFEKALANPMKIGIYDLIDDIIGKEGRKHLAVVGSVGLFIFLSNAISLIPNTTSPTIVHVVPLGAAMVVFIYYHVAGIQKFGGFGYSKQFVGHAFAMPKLSWWIMVPLFAAIEVVSHSARLVSLTARLWANIFASELLYVTFLGLTSSLFLFSWDWSAWAGGAVIVFPLTSPLMVPLLFIGLHFFVAIVQAFVFTLLPIIYLGGATVEEH